MKSLGIDIGSSSIKIVEVQATSKGYQVTRFIEHLLSSSPEADHELEILEFLRSVSEKYDHTQTRFVFALPQHRIATRSKFFPFNDRIKISRSLPFELEEDIPFSSDNAIFDAKIIRTVGQGAEVIACAAPHVHVQNAIQLAKDCNLDPYLISCEGTAFANPFEDWNNPPPAVHDSFDIDGLKVERHLRIHLHLGHTRSLVNIFEGNSLIQVSSILWGGKNIADAIAKKYDIPYIEALKELQTKSFILTNKQGATFDQVTFSDTIANSVREMSRDLQMQILEIKSDFNAQIDKIALSGGTSMIQNLGPFLTQTLEIPANRVSALDLVPNVLIERDVLTGTKVGVALGLAFEGFKKPRNPPINFQRGEFAKENNQLKSFFNQWGHTIKYASALLVLLFVYSSVRSNFATTLVDATQDTLKDQAKAVAGLTGKNATESGIKKYILENKKRAGDLKRLSNVVKMNTPLDITKKISGSLPSRQDVSLDIHQLEIVDTNVRLRGYVKSQQEVERIRSSLVSVSANGQVKTTQVNFAQIPGRVAFAFELQVDRNVEKVTQ